MLGKHEKAEEALRAALRVNPDYTIARNNLHMLANMSEDEYQEKLKSGFFKILNQISEDPL